MTDFICVLVSYHIMPIVLVVLFLFFITYFLECFCFLWHIYLKKLPHLKCKLSSKDNIINTFVNTVSGSNITRTSAGGQAQSILSFTLLQHNKFIYKVIKWQIASLWLLTYLFTWQKSLNVESIPHHWDVLRELEIWKTLIGFFICCHAKRSAESEDTSDGIAFAWSIMFITESDLLCLPGRHEN